jgi:hypothetical protein
VNARKEKLFVYAFILESVSHFTYIENITVVKNNLPRLPEFVIVKMLWCFSEMILEINIFGAYCMNAFKISLIISPYPLLRVQYKSRTAEWSFINFNVQVH